MTLTTNWSYISVILLQLLQCNCVKEAGDIFHALKIYLNSFGQFTKIFYWFFSLLVTSSSTCFLLIYCNELLFHLTHTFLLMPVYCKYEIIIVKDVVKNHFRRTTRAINADVGKLTYSKILQWEYLTDILSCIELAEWK